MDWAVFETKFNKKCKHCGRPLNEGDRVAGKKGEDGKWTIICLSCLGKEEKTKVSAVKPKIGGSVMDYREALGAPPKKTAEGLFDTSSVPNIPTPKKPAVPTVRADSLAYFKQNAQWGM